jgi:predicted enzyme related to lactoylglutathione lyase
MARVIHFEIHASDPARAAKFYGALFGWEITKWAGPADYWIIRTGAPDQPGIDGGLVPRRGASPVDGQPVNAYVCTVNVDSVDAAIAKVEAIGGSVAVPKMPIPGMGWLAYGKDPEGNIFGVMQNDPGAA